MAKTAAETIYVLNARTSIVGTREPELCHAKLARRRKLAPRPGAIGLKADAAVQSRRELIDFIHERSQKGVGIIINAGGYSHTSIALHDALVAVKFPRRSAHPKHHAARSSVIVPSPPEPRRTLSGLASRATGSRSMASPPDRRQGKS